jgi:hypothetical protein
MFPDVLVNGSSHSFNSRTPTYSPRRARRRTAKKRGGEQVKKYFRMERGTVYEYAPTATRGSRRSGQFDPQRRTKLNGSIWTMTRRRPRLHLPGFKHFLRPLHIRALMRKQLSTLAFQVVERQQQLSVAVTRIQRGFMPRESTLEASRHVQDMAKILREIEESLKTNFDHRQVKGNNV